MQTIELIKDITNYHPASNAGLKRGWSHYTGGMKDSGDWYYRKLLDASDEELQRCLNELIQEWKPRPEPEYTEEEKRQMRNIIPFADGTGFTTEYTATKMKNFFEELERKLFGL